MPIRKFGTEPAKAETRTQDNDPDTLRALAEVDEFLAHPETGKTRSRRDRDSNDGQAYSV